MRARLPKGLCKLMESRWTTEREPHLLPMIAHVSSFPCSIRAALRSVSLELGTWFASLRGSADSVSGASADGGRVQMGRGTASGAILHPPRSVIQVLPDYNVSHVPHGHRPDRVRAHHLNESVQKMRCDDTRVSSIKTIVPGSHSRERLRF